MINKTICALSCAISVIVLCGCQRPIGTRIEHNIDRCQQDFRARSPIWRRCATNILSGLSTADAITLKAPVFASAAMGRDESGEYRFYLYWLEDMPSVDGVELCVDNTNSIGIIAVSPSDRERNIKDSEVSVVFVASWIWSSKDSIWNKLESIDDVSKLKLRLLKFGKPVTDFQPVTFYRLDRWMGTEETTEVTTGPSIRALKPAP